MTDGDRIKSLEIDNFNLKQELGLFKATLKKELQLEYDEFKNDNNASVFNEDNFQANYATIVRIFKTLKRLGIQFE